MSTTRFLFPLRPARFVHNQPPRGTLEIFGIGSMASMGQGRRGLAWTLPRTRTHPPRTCLLEPRRQGHPLLKWHHKKGHILANLSIRFSLFHSGSLSFLSSLSFRSIRSFCPYRSVRPFLSLHPFLCSFRSFLSNFPLLAFLPCDRRFFLSLLRPPPIPSFSPSVPSSILFLPLFRCF